MRKIHKTSPETKVSTQGISIAKQFEKELGRLSKLKPWKNVKFNLDRIANIPREFITDREINNIIRKGIEGFRRDGASHSWTTFKIDEGDIYDIDATMNDETAARILPHIGSKNYFFFRIKCIIQADNG